MKRVLISGLVTIGLVLGAPAVTAQASAKHYANCTAMHKVYKHGVKKTASAKNKGGKQFSGAKVSASLYAANKGSDRDHDNWACEA